MGNGAEHSIIHVGAVAERVELGSAVAELSPRIEAIVDRGGWPPRSAAFARYNLACFHALAGRLDEARALLRVALPAEADLREFAQEDADLAALREELPELAKGRTTSAS